MSNTVTAYFKGRIGVCESVYQHDYGLVLVLDDIDFGTSFDAYFEIMGEDEAIPAVGQNDRVAIPNSCLANAGKVRLHIPVHSGENDSEVEYIVELKVIGRAKPVDDGTPADQVAIAQAIAALQEAKRDIPEDIQSYYDSHIAPNIEDNVNDWLDDHPEATSTVQDHSLTHEKMVNGTLGFVIPQMFGAKGDGVTDDTQAFVDALAKIGNGGILRIPSGTYLVKPDTITLSSNQKIIGDGYPVIITKEGAPYKYIMGNDAEAQLSNIEISGICFDQDYEVGKFAPSSEATASRCIYLRNVDSLRLHNNKFMNLMGMHGILVSESIDVKGAKDIVISGNTIIAKRIGYPNADDFYDQSAIYVDSESHVIQDNYINSINTGARWWEIPGGIETHCAKSTVCSNLLKNCMIGINVVCHWFPTGEKGMQSIFANNMIDCVQGVVLWAAEDPVVVGDQIFNIDVYDNFFGLRSSKNTLFGGGVCTTATDLGTITNLSIHNNAFDFDKSSISNYAGTMLLSALDKSLFKMQNKNKINGLYIKDNVIRNWGGCVLGVARTGTEFNIVHEDIVFENNIIENCTWAKTQLIWYTSMFFLSNCRKVAIVDNEIRYGSAENYPTEYGATMLYLADDVEDLQFLNNKIEYSDYYNVFCTITDYRSRKDIVVDLNAFRKMRDEDFKVVKTKNGQPTEGTFVVGDIYQDFEFDTQLVTYTNFYNGTIGDSSGVCNVSSDELNAFSVTNNAEYEPDTFIKCGDVISAVHTRRGDKYMVYDSLVAGSNIAVNYNATGWAHN